MLTASQVLFVNHLFEGPNINLIKLILSHVFCRIANQGNVC